jgi:hypothetical protein
MSTRQKYLNTVRDLQKELDKVLQAGQFTKESERFMVQEAITNLKITEKHLQGFLQVDKERGN